MLAGTSGGVSGEGSKSSRGFFSRTKEKVKRWKNRTFAQQEANKAAQKRYRCSLCRPLTSHQTKVCLSCIVPTQDSCQPQKVHHLMPQRYNMRSKLFCSCLCAKNGTPGAVLGTSTMTCQDSSMSAPWTPVRASYFPCSLEAKVLTAQTAALQLHIHLLPSI